VITGAHLLVYADDADAARAFFRDVLRWPYVDAHGGWLIFKTGPSELGVHPSAGDVQGQPWSVGPHHEISLMCDDIAQTVEDLRARGTVFVQEIKQEGFGVTAKFEVPGAGEIMLYEPRHPVAYDL
jgi:predicted enzyme related to lactoylglutathione lyase